MEKTISRFKHRYCNIYDEEFAKLVPGSMWSSIDLLSIFQSTYNCSLKILLIYRNKTIVASLPLFYKTAFRIDYIFNPLQYYYYHISYYFAEKEKELRNRQMRNDIMSYIAILLGKDFRKLELKLSTATYDIRPFQIDKYLIKPLYTFILDTSVRDYNNNQLTHIRRAETFDLKITNDFHLDESLTILGNRFEQKGIWGNERAELYNALMEKISTRDYIKNYSVYHNSKLVAFRMVLLDSLNSVAYDWFTASNKFAMDNGINSYLLDYIIKDLEGMGIKKYDLCGANVPTVAKFKNDFGGELNIYFFIQKKIANFI
ncbi:MAG: GNAT family N-acetyltransferase [Candidatus Cloacimonadales bacterium]|jgi:hypothetical protein|nr:GNAT family N-acetyltransferase [Candidatus Cloacimonadota bacterium]MDD2649718.1 GNAT family N-acetyltransferase [Candidatus Cloacimonadota bacterium]MDD3500803.1 GNAT family N-acetyltransferase [Candidatus Cloacimonadota bacterium]MDX9977295.1 GNAT family N-acetyltransferase [Candidatus Cloacimonadales bacterium]